MKMGRESIPPGAQLPLYSRQEMSLVKAEQNQPEQVHGSDRAQLGGWLFRHRTMTPVPLLVALLVVRTGTAPASATLLSAGIAVVAFGEALRLWGVHHIGAISRTRTDRLGPLVDSGPFARVRNPLYLGNMALWVGFALVARLVWMAPLLALVLALEYHAIVRWEEDLLESRIGQAYRDYMRRVPRWLPMLRRAPRERRAEQSPSRPAIIADSWRRTLFSERGTLMAIAAGFGLIWLKFKI
jgi:protein-S-isoprenylcysteine O-methyltransferase Ste14